MIKDILSINPNKVNLLDSTAVTPTFQAILIDIAQEMGVTLKVKDDAPKTMTNPSSGYQWKQSVDATITATKDGAHAFCRASDIKTGDQFRKWLKYVFK